MLNITVSMLNTIAPGANQTIVAGLVKYLMIYLPKYNITTLDELKHFLGQAAEESAGFKTLTEYASGEEYEGRKDLGNTVAGYGVKFKGRGIFQITGFYNYQAMSKALGVDLISNPTLAATAEISVQTACQYWNLHNLSAIADSNLSFEDTCVAITRKINGGINGLSDRISYTTRAQSVLQGAAIIPDPVNVVPVVTEPVKAPTVSEPIVNVPPALPVPPSANTVAYNDAVKHAHDPLGPFEDVVQWFKRFF